MEPHARSVFERPGAWQDLDDGVGETRRLEGAGGHEALPALDLLDLDAGDIDGRPLPSDRLRLAGAVHLHAAHLDLAVSRRNHQLVVGPHAAGNEGAGDNRPEAFHREDAIDRQSRDTVSGVSPHSRGGGDQGRTKFVEALARFRRHGHHRRALEKRPRDQLTHLEPHELQRLGVNQVRLRHRDEPGRHAQQPADVEMLSRLRHHRLVGGDHEHHEIDPADAGQHVLDKALVTRDIDEGDVQVIEHEVGKPEVDRDAAGFLFLQPVGIGAGERANQSALAVVDVPRRTDDDGFHKVRRYFYLLPSVSPAALVAGSASCPAWASPCSGADLARLHVRARGCRPGPDRSASLPC